MEEIYIVTKEEIGMMVESAYKEFMKVDSEMVNRVWRGENEDCEEVTGVSNLEYLTDGKSDRELEMVKIFTPSNIKQLLYSDIDLVIKRYSEYMERLDKEEEKAVEGLERVESTVARDMKGLFTVILWYIEHLYTVWYEITDTILNDQIVPILIYNQLSSSDRSKLYLIDNKENIAVLDKLIMEILEQRLRYEFEVVPSNKKSMVHKEISEEIRESVTESQESIISMSSEQIEELIVAYEVYYVDKLYNKVSNLLGMRDTLDEVDLEEAIDSVIYDVDSEEGLVDKSVEYLKKGVKSFGTKYFAVDIPIDGRINNESDALNILMETLENLREMATEDEEENNGDKKRRKGNGK